MKQPLLRYYGCLRGDLARAMLHELTCCTPTGPVYPRIKSGPLKGCYNGTHRGNRYVYKVGRGRGYVLIFKPVIRVNIDATT